MASHAHSIPVPLARQTTGSAGLLLASLPGGRIVAAGGPVTRALAVMAAADPDLARIRVLRRSIAERIEADIALLDALAGDTDLEDGFDAEGNTDDNGVADMDGAGEQGHCAFAYGFDRAMPFVGGSGL